MDNNQNNQQEVPQVKSVDTPKCKCGGRAALSSGRWYYEPDEEPYESGKNEVAKVPEGDAWVHGFICDDCGSVQSLFVDENSYQSRIAELEAKNKELVEAFELISKVHDSKDVKKSIVSWEATAYQMYAIAEQALNSKDNGI